MVNKQLEIDKKAKKDVLRAIEPEGLNGINPLKFLERKTRGKYSIDYLRRVCEALAEDGTIILVKDSPLGMITSIVPIPPEEKIYSDLSIGAKRESTFAKCPESQPDLNGPVVVRQRKPGRPTKSHKGKVGPTIPYVKRQPMHKTLTQALNELRRCADGEGIGDQSVFTVLRNAFPSTMKDGSVSANLSHLKNMGLVYYEFNSNDYAILSKDTEVTKDMLVNYFKERDQRQHPESTKSETSDERSSLNKSSESVVTRLLEVVNLLENKVAELKQSLTSVQQRADDLQRQLDEREAVGSEVTNLLNKYGF